MIYSCLRCSRKISPLNLRNLQCKTCKQFCHPKCARYCPPVCLKRIRNRYKVVRNNKWQCEFCVLQELPFYNIPDSQFSTLAYKQDQKREPHIPSCQELNELFLTNGDEVGVENDNELSSSYINHDSKYIYSSDIRDLNFNDEVVVHGSFPMISLNIRSIVNRDNFTKFEAFVDNLATKPLVIALNETWVSSKSAGPYQSLEGYQFVQNHRKNTVGGGVAFYVSDKIHFNKIEALSIMNEKVFESLFIELDIDGKNILCGTIYRSPSQNHQDFIAILTKTLIEGMKINKNIIIAGDMNYDLIDTENTFVNSFTSTFFEYGFFPLINIPTRITNTTAKVLDHAWTNILDMPIQSAVLCNPVSDHLPIFINFAAKKAESKLPIQKRNFSEQNITMFNSRVGDMEILDTFM